MASVPVIRFPILLLNRILGFLTAAIVVVWSFHFRGGMFLFSENKDLIFNVHPVLMLIGLILLNGEAMLAYKTVSGTKNLKKLVHSTLQFLAFCFGTIGLWAALKFHNEKGIDNFYSLHSWLGLACIFLLSRYSTEALLVNFLGILIVALGGCMILAVVAPLTSRGDHYRDGPVE